MREDEARIAEAPRNPSPRMPDANMLAGAETCAKQECSRDVSYIDPSPEKQVVLSERMEYLARRVGGCQTDELLALLRRVVYESIARSKY